MSSYRDRIYKNYVHARQQPLAPQTLKGLKLRKPYLTKMIQAHFPTDRNAPILDLGCGHGALIYYARQQGYNNITGVDHSPEQVAEAKRLGIRWVEQADLMDKLKSLSNATQDLIITFDVIEHFNKEELLEFIDNVYRVLKSGGGGLYTAPTENHPLRPECFTGILRMNWLLPAHPLRKFCSLQVFQW